MTVTTTDVHRRARLLEDLAGIVTELVAEVRCVEVVADWWPTRDHPDYVDVPTLPRNPSRYVHRTSDLGLLHQLRRRRRAVAKPRRTVVDASWLLGTDVETPRRSEGGGGHHKPGSKPPSDLAAVDLLARVDSETRQWWERLDGGRTRTTLAARIQGLVGLAAQADVDDLDDLVHDASWWARSARLLLGYDAPPLVLGWPCPDCGAELRCDRTDWIWCTGRLDDGARCGNRWPRSSWVLFLDATTANG